LELVQPIGNKLKVARNLVRFLSGLKYYLVNHIVASIPNYAVRHAVYRTVLGYSIGIGSSIHMNVFVSGKEIRIGDYSTIGRRCYLDGRGGLFIGNSVSISPDVQFLTAQHDMNDPSFISTRDSVTIDDYVWVGTRALILPGVCIKKGAVVAAGAVVTKNVEPFTVVGGVPAKLIGKRNTDIAYRCEWFYPFD